MLCRSVIPGLFLVGLSLSPEVSFGFDPWNGPAIKRTAPEIVTSVPLGPTAWSNPERAGALRPVTTQQQQPQYDNEEKGFHIRGQYRTAGLNLPEASHSMRATCRRYVPRPRTNFCKNPEKYAKMFDAASKAVGIPSVSLVCMTYAETSMAENIRTSTAGAQGLTQFMPATARLFVAKYRQSKEYRKNFTSYKSSLARPELLFSEKAILTNHLSEADTPVQIFASALYFRDVLNSWSRMAENSLASVPGFYRLNRALMAAYNAGPGVGTCYLRRTCSVPRETAGYMPKIEACIQNAIRTDPRSQRLARRAER